jgi:hypothetical protein
VIQRSIATGFEGRVGLYSLEDEHTHAAYRRVDDATRFLTRTT